MLSSEKKDLYDGIKQYLCVNCLTPSQCVVARTLDKPQTLMTIVTKIAQQMNCKMGGALRKVETGVRWISLPSLYFTCVQWNLRLNHLKRNCLIVLLLCSNSMSYLFLKISVTECDVHWYRLFP